MVFFITCLRALAACLITNAHYTGIYPIGIIANGGLIGDVLFFAVSGYCLYHVKDGFARWYAKRIYRVYPPVLIMTAVYLLLGFYSLEEHTLSWWLLYPTYYHFVASIVLLYIPFYFIMRSQWLRNHIPGLMAVIAGVWLAVYFLGYDRSYYHIDTVREPMIRFLFLESMLLGAWFRQNDGQIRNTFRMGYVPATLAAFVLYFGSKLVFSRIDRLAPLQFLNQILIFLLLYCLFRLFAGLDAKLEKLPGAVKKGICAISAATLEIYVVQYVPIRQLRKVITQFPLNWIVITLLIALLAWGLRLVCRAFYRQADKIVKL